MHTTFSSLIIVAAFLVSIPEASAFRLKTQIAKPTRGNYQSVADEKASRLNTFARPKQEKVTTRTFASRTRGISFSHPDSWAPKDLKDAIRIEPEDDPVAQALGKYSAIFMTDRLLVPKRTMTPEEIDRRFMQRATLSPSLSLGDWYIPSFNLIESSDASLFGRPARLYVYTGEIGSVKYKTMQYITSFDDREYSVFLRAHTDDYEKHLPVFEQVVQSLKITKASASSKVSASSKSSAPASARPVRRR